MTLEPTTLYFPAIQKTEKRNSDEVNNWLMKKGQKMFAAYSKPARPYPGTEKVVGRLIDGRIRFDAERQLLLESYVHGLQAREVTDTPRFLPFQGMFIKKAIQRFKAWRAKRARRKFEDWVNRAPKPRSIFSSYLNR